MKTNTTLRLTRAQYRALAEQVKQVGCCLGLSTFLEMGRNWGIFNPMVHTVLIDASAEQIQFDERAHIQLATSINTADLRSQQRPEIDWSMLEDHEIYPFVVAHEIGHRVDNFDFWDVARIEDEGAKERCIRSLRSINEVLADRYAWSQIRPGEPIPLCEYGKAIEESVAADMELLNKHSPRIRRGFIRPCPPGQYAYIPREMLMTSEMVAYVGPDVSPKLVGQVRDRSRVYRRDSRSRAR